jgi:hypothetical protein
VPKHGVQIRIGHPPVAVPHLGGDTTVGTLGTAYQESANRIEVHEQSSGFRHYTPLPDRRHRSRPAFAAASAIGSAFGLLDNQFHCCAIDDFDRFVQHGELVGGEGMVSLDFREPFAAILTEILRQRQKVGF